MRIQYILLFFHATLLIPIHNVKAEDYQYQVSPDKVELDTEQDKVLRTLCLPVRFSRSGVQDFMKNIFSRKEYADFLPHNFCHLIEFLEFGKNTQQNNLFSLSTLRLFNNGLKRCSYANAGAINTFLDKFPGLLEHHLTKKQPSFIAQAKSTIKRVLYSTFLSKFSAFKQDPDLFFDDLSNEIIQGLNNSEYSQHSIDREQLRQTAIRFLETALNKAMWSPLDESSPWISVKEISIKLAKLQDEEIVNQDELDDLYHSLINRFIYFLQIAGSELSIEVIDEIRTDIKTHSLLLLTMEEQEEYITTKSERLEKTLDETEAKIIARQHGIITEVLPQ